MNVVPREELNTSFKPGLVSIIQIICLTGGKALGNAFLSKEMRKAESSCVLLSALLGGSCRISCSAAEFNSKAPLHPGETGILLHLPWAAPE